ncbi:very short patch repair endonuclease [uncultured Victivallis sp.]|jgi:DNA mismatch endonuclease vsr|uniref:very short patch repair endonuclease n=1 Tax=uncultured Victivallis sp. TaxID=354118 RepID=UPI0025933551|nr:very short patch repair endonuclease [uncultured Victivallis sp.]
MPERLTKEERSRLMSKVHGKNTLPELAVRSFLHQAGFRFRLHGKHLPGHPDIVLSKYKTVIFVHGCFWHRHDGCKRTTTPQKNSEFWENKFKQNKLRDKNTNEQLQNIGWDVIVIWECEVKNRIFEDKLLTFLSSKMKTCTKD